MKTWLGQKKSDNFFLTRVKAKTWNCKEHKRPAKSFDDYKWSSWNKQAMTTLQEMAVFNSLNGSKVA